MFPDNKSNFQLLYASMSCLLHLGQRVFLVQAGQRSRYLGGQQLLREDHKSAYEPRWAGCQHNGRRVSPKLPVLLYNQVFLRTPEEWQDQWNLPDKEPSQSARL